MFQDIRRPEQPRPCHSISQPEFSIGPPQSAHTHIVALALCALEQCGEPLECSNVLLRARELRFGFLGLQVAVEGGHERAVHVVGL